MSSPAYLKGVNGKPPEAKLNSSYRGSSCYLRCGDSAEPPLPVVRRGFPGIRFHLSSASNRPGHYLASSELLIFSREDTVIYIFFSAVDPDPK